MKHRFFCKLTGGNETPPLSDLALPISSFSLRRTSAVLSLSVVVPSLDLATEIADRANGELVLEWYGDNSLAEEMARAAVDTVTPHEGASSKSITILGQISGPVWPPLEDDVTIEKITYRAPNGSSGKYSYQVPVPYQNLFPGATVVYDSHSFTLGDVQIEVSSNAGGISFACYLKEA